MNNTKATPDFKISRKMDTSDSVSGMNKSKANGDRRKTQWLPGEGQAIEEKRDLPKKKFCKFYRQVA